MWLLSIGTYHEEDHVTPLLGGANNFSWRTLKIMNFGGAHDTCFKYVFASYLRKRKEQNRTEALEISK